jgi:phosphate starvation-inducible protein PhoH
MSESETPTVPNPRYANRRNKEERAKLNEFFASSRIQDIIKTKPPKYVDKIREIIQNELGMKITNVAIYYRLRVMRDKEAKAQKEAEAVGLLDEYSDASYYSDSDVAVTEEYEESNEEQTEEEQTKEQQHELDLQTKPYTVTINDRVQLMTSSELLHYIINLTNNGGNYDISIKAK